MKKKILFLFLFLLILFPLVNAQPPLEQGASNFAEGYEIEFTKLDVIKVNETHLFNVHVFNISNGLRLTNTTTSCGFHLFNSSGNHIIDQQEMTFNEFGFDWEYEASPGNFTLAGDYSYLVVCNETNFGGLISIGFHVTESGFSINEGNSTILFTVILFMMILGTIFITAFFKKEGKFQVKWTFFVLGYILFLSGLTLTQISLRDSLVNPAITNFLDTFLATGFIIFWFAFGLLIIIWIITTLQTLLFDKIQKNIQKFE
ncbi:hypothetical protein LCGC14_1080130 [marine sediment metagenome]|uniref:Uncharacterized protein n=1 Tax=marine sediment metagenome TaxID=412755 RepID=A0A0F9MFM1_9ZZZZ